MHELSKRFWFDAAHTLKREIAAESSKRVHGHSYRAEVVICGTPDPKTGMLMDLGHLELMLADVRAALDHHFLDEVGGLGPATMENLAQWIWDRLMPSLNGLARVTIYRPSGGETCTYVGTSAG